MEDDTRSKIVSLVEERFDTEIDVIRFESVGGTIGKEVTNQAAIAVSVSALGVICAIAAMIHDFLVVLSIAAIGGKVFGWQFDTLFLTAFLTVIGFSVQDKIVVFDRIRENSNIFRKISFTQLTNHSIVQTLGRSINTQLMTSEFLLLALG